MRSNQLGVSYQLTPDRSVFRMGYGAMQLAGPGVFGPPKDPDEAIAVLRRAVELGVNHIDTSDFYGPHITNQLIKRALYPYPKELTIVTKVGARRDETGGWPHARTPQELRQAVEENLKNLGLDVLEVVNLRLGGGTDNHSPEQTSVAEPLGALLEMQRPGLIKHIGLSTVTAEQVREAQTLGEIVCVQNFYNVANRQDDSLIDELARQNIAYVPYFPLGGFTPLQSTRLQTVANELSESPQAVALAWLLQRSENILLIPGTGSIRHLEANVQSASLKLSTAILERLNSAED